MEKEKLSVWLTHILFIVFTPCFHIKMRFQNILVYNKLNLTCIAPILLHILLDFLLSVKAATLIFISGCGSAIPSAREGKSGFIYNLVKS